MTAKCIYTVYFSELNEKVSDISSIHKLTKLQTLHLSRTNISDISILSNMPNLEVLSIDGTNVKDVSVLFELKNLKELCVNINQLTSSDIEKLRAMGVEITFQDVGNDE